MRTYYTATKSELVLKAESAQMANSKEPARPGWVLLTAKMAAVLTTIGRIKK